MIEEIDYAEFEVVVGEDEEYYAGTSGPRERALNEAIRYANGILGEGDVTIYEVKRTFVMTFVGTDTE